MGSENIGELVRRFASELEKAGIGSARLDSLILLEDAAGKDRSWLLAHPEHTLSGSKVGRLQRQIARRAKHEPLSYIRGFSEFYGRRFKVNKDVLEPRPESEDMISLFNNLVRTEPGLRTALDLGTGSGALAITAKLENPKMQVSASDIDAKCLKLAKANASVHGADIAFFKGDLLAPFPGLPADILLANLPYVPAGYRINQAAAMEPGTAIFGGGDGLEVYRQLFRDLQNRPKKPRFVLTEALPPHHPQLAAIAAGSGYKLRQAEGFVQVFEI
jgi:release factor glutamine methyltransferase